MAGSVRAMFNYTYEYEGTKISFKKDEEFQLLAKSNQDWWQVRRWNGDGCAQDIYVPAVYVKEVKSEAKKRENLYQNISDVRKQMEELEKLEKEKSNGEPKLMPPPVAKRTHKEANKPVDENVVTSPSRKKPPLVTKRSLDQAPEEKTSQVDLSKSAPLSVLERLNRPSSYKKPDGPGPIPATSPKPRTRSIESHPQKDLPSPTPQEGEKANSKIPPPTLPKSQKQGRPKSMVITSPTHKSPPEVVESQVRVTAVASQLEAVLAGRQLSRESDSVQRTSSGQKLISAEGEPATTTAKALNLRKTPSPKSETSNLPVMTNGQAEEVPSPTPNSLPVGWTEHKTSSGHLYYYNSSTGQSSWTRPSEAASSTEASQSQLEKRPPRGWTRQINPITSTPIYTNSRTGERWSVASDGAGNFYYYNMANPSLTVGELPAVAEVPAAPSAHATPTRTAAQPENIYDTLLPVDTKPSEPESQVPAPQGEVKGVPQSSSSAPVPSHLGVFANSLSGSMSKHGYLQKKKMYDAQGRKAKGSWQRLYVMFQNAELVFYSDHKTKELPGAKPLSTFSLLHCTVSPHSRRDLKKTTFQVSSPFGEQFLLQAETPALMNNWYSTIQTTIDSANQEYKDHPERFKDSLPENSGESSPKLKTKEKGKRLLSRTASNAEDLLVDDENDPMFMDISPEDKSVRVRTRLKKLMAKRPQADQLRKKGILEDPVFGCELSTLCEREGSKVPHFLVRFMEHIERKGLDVVGIYRLSGNAASVNKLRYQVDQGEDINLEDQEWTDINIVTGCLKLYLRELPDPIIPFKMFRSFIDAARAPSQSQRVQNITARVMELPVPNYCTLKALIKHFKKVVEYGQINKMQASNVAIVFGPTLMRAEMDSMEMAILMPVQNGIVEIMINDFESVFRK